MLTIMTSYSCFRGTLAVPLVLEMGQGHGVTSLHHAQAVRGDLATKGGCARQEASLGVSVYPVLCCPSGFLPSQPQHL